MALHPRSPEKSQAVQGVLYRVVAAGVTITVGFVRAVLLARLLLPEHFGVVALAMFYIALAAQLRAVGLDQALLHRQEAHEAVWRTYFTLRLATLFLSSLILLAAAPFLAHLYPTMPLLAGILLALTGVEIIKGLSTIQETFLAKDLAFRQLAFTDVAASVVMTGVAPLLAWLGWGVWALVAEQASGTLTRLGMIWTAFRRWSPRLGWDGTIARWFWTYGKPSWGASNLNFLLDRFDDFWIGTTLGQNPLGYYSRAYELAHYPRRVVANPLVSVFGPLFARLQGDRLRLSQAFYRAAYVILRSGFLLSGAFALVMPEFIHLVIGDQWTPMLVTFRLLLIYTLLDALLLLGGSLLFAVGRPYQAWRIMTVQVLFFIPAVILGTHLWGINGVALAADGMLVIGGVVLYKHLCQVVDFSLLRLVFWPTLALGAAWSAGIALETAKLLAQPWEMGAGKLALFTSVYLGLLLVMERKEALQGARWIWSNVWPRDQKQII